MQAIIGIRQDLNLAHKNWASLLDIHWIAERDGRRTTSAMSCSLLLPLKPTQLTLDKVRAMYLARLKVSRKHDDSLGLRI